MYKLSAILYQFNRPLFVANTVLSLYLIYRRDVVTYPDGLFVKLCVFAILIACQYLSNNKIYFYFRNAGYSIRRLYSYSIIADLVIYSILFVISSII